TCTPACAASAASWARAPSASCSPWSAKVTSSAELRVDLLTRSNFPAAGTDVTCAVSGGADSLALLVLAVAAGCRVTAAHVDHGLRAGSAAEGLAPVADPSNADPAFRRNRVRHEALPLLSEIARRDVAGVVARQAALLRADADLLDALAAPIDPTDAGALAAAPVALARRA